MRLILGLVLGIYGNGGPRADAGAVLLSWDDANGNQQLIQWDDVNGIAQYLEWDI